jgi:L-ascorbate metabolism protein UlaG (beta-lactamase superfamily)
MLEIEYKGGNTIVLSTKKSRVIVDPKLSLVGLKDMGTKDAVVLATEDRFLVSGDDAKLVIEGPGEYGVDDLDIRGIAARRHIDTENEGMLSTIYRVSVGDLRVAVIGNIHNELSESQLEEIGVVDILIVPVGGGGYTLDATSATNLARSIDANVIIPVHYGDKVLKYEVPQESLDVFLKEMGVTHETVSKYKVKQVASIPATTTVVEVTRS